MNVGVVDIVVSQFVFLLSTSRYVLILPYFVGHDECNTKIFHY